MTATYDDDPTDDPWKSPTGMTCTLTMFESDEVEIVEGRVDDYVAVKRNGGVKDNVKRGPGS